MRIFEFPMMAVLCLSVAGCVPLQYRSPGGKDLAEIIFHNAVNSTATAEIFDKAEDCQTRRVTAPIAPGAAVSARLPAGREVSFSLGYKSDGSRRSEKYCRVYATFSPAPQAQYDAFITAGQEGCRLELLKSSGLPPETVSFRQREPLASPLTEYSGFCR